MKTGICIATLALWACAAIAQQPQNPPSESTAPQTGQQNPSTPAGRMGAPDRNEMKTQTYKGTLMDASCAMPQSGMTQPAEDKKTPDTSGSSAGSANRSSAEGSCGVSNSTNQFALKTADGKTLRLDMVGNQRVQDEIKTNKKWSDAATSGKPIKVKVSGAVTGDKLIVSSIH